jgi:adenosylmethionine-8-amino-7-oxononanoate aminotransferase
VPGYFRAVREVCDRHGLPADPRRGDVRDGAHGHAARLRAGRASRPDLIAIAKGLGGGYQPIGAVLAQRRIVDAMSRGSGFFQHGPHRTSGTRSRAPAALAVQRVIARDGPARARARARRVARAQAGRPLSRPPARRRPCAGAACSAASSSCATSASRAPFDPARQTHARVKREEWRAA